MDREEGEFQISNLTSVINTKDVIALISSAIRYSMLTTIIIAMMVILVTYV